MSLVPPPRTVRAPSCAPRIFAAARTKGQAPYHVPAQDEGDERANVRARVDHLGHRGGSKEVLGEDGCKCHDEEHAGAGAKDSVVEGNGRHGG